MPTRNNLNQQLLYWEQQLGGELPVLEIPSDYPRSPLQSFIRAKESVELSEEFCLKFDKFCQDENFTVFTTLLAAFKILLLRYMGQKDIIVGSLSADSLRSKEGANPETFINPVVLRTNLTSELTARELCQRVGHKVEEAVQNRDYPFEKLIVPCGHQNLTRAPIFQVMLVLCDVPFCLSQKPIWEENLAQQEHSALCDLVVLASKKEGNLIISGEYNAELFESASIRRILGHLQTLLENLIANPDQCISTLPLLTEPERHQLLVKWNDTNTDFPFDKCIHQLFEEQVTRSPSSVAVVFEGEQLTYQQLNARANRIAHYLQSLGVGPEVLVGICVERSPLMIVGLLGILKAGGAYVPLDPTYPQERLSFMLADSQVQVLLTQQKFVEQFSESRMKTVCLDKDWESIDRHSQDNPTSDVTAENLAYVIYTSGSTGTPKGVAIPHRAVNRLVCNTNYVQLEPNERMGQASNTSFDAATFEIWGSLLHGATLVGIPQNVLLSPQDFAAYIREQRISILFLTTALFNHLANVVPHAFKYLRNLVIGGEALNPKSVKAVLKNGAPQRLVNGYGPTQSTTFACWYLVQDIAEEATNLPIGRPISNTQIYILDSELQPVTVGIPGELHIGGDGLARGYLNRPELTEEKFIPNPFEEVRGSKLYKTGDLARYLPDGNIEFLGRVDNQVKIRGFRIELGEIEALLSQHPDVYQAVVIVREDIPADRRLVAYIVPNQKLAANTTSLKRFLEDKLPRYMMPEVLMILDSLPLTPNGKVDRRNLPAPDRTRPDLEATFVAPRNSIEEKLAVIWTQLLGLDLIGVNDNFFELGGHSLIATQMLSRVREVFSLELSFDRIFTNPTIASLAQLIAQGDKEQQWQRPAIERIPHEGLLPVSFAQERVYFIQQLAPENSAYQFQATIRFRGRLDVTVLQRCLDEIVQRHEIFRTTYPALNGRLFQVINPHQPISFTVIDLQSFPESERETEAQKLVEKEVQKPLDITQLPLVKWVLLKLSHQEHLLLHIEHHMAHDGWSFNVFLGELVELYQAFNTGQPSPLTEPRLQFADFAHWQREWVKTPEAQAQLNYWQQKLSGSSPLLELPYNRPRPTEQTYNGDQIRMELPIDLCESLRVLSRQQGATLFMTMLAAFFVMLHRYTGQDDICVGTAVANRRLHEIEKLIGMIVNNLVLRTDLSGNPTFRELLGRLRQVTMEAYANEDLPFDKVVEVLKPIRNLSHNPLFQVMFSFHDSAMPNLSLPDLDISLHEPISNKSSKFDLDFLVIPRFEQSVQHGAKTRAKGITLVLEYNSDLFDAATIQAMLEQYQKLLIEIVVNPEQQIGKLPLLTQYQAELLEKWNQTHREYTQVKCIHELFESQVELTPDAVAIQQEGQQLTYRELSDRANQLAHYLHSLGVKPETLVGICVERSLEMIVGLLGILKSGGAYIPLDPAYPQERLADILADTQLSILLTQERFQDKIPDYAGKTIYLDKDWPVIAQYSTANPISDVQLDNLAYIIYTSGSTGKPKGVMIEHRSLINFVMTATHEYGINAGDRILQFASIYFDTSIEEIFPSLLVGATLVLRTEQMLHSSDEFWRCCREWELSVLDLPTAYWHQLVAELNPQDGRIPASLKMVIIGGEEAQLEKVKHWHTNVAHLPNPPQLFNGYGPTEATVITTLHHLNSSAATSVAIGRPISNAQVYVLDQYLQRVPIGVPGELHIGGDGLARGYLNHLDLTQEKFIPNSFSNEPGSRLYKTGDKARYLPDGNIEFLGRIDNQVKIRGYRIELGEIEAAIAQYPGVRETVVVVREDIPGDKRLVAYIVPIQVPATCRELRHFLLQKLPDYMVPNAIVVLSAMPLTPNGKVDRRALPAPDSSPSDSRGFVPPRDTVEQQLQRIWSEVLQLSTIGVHDNFFELGGHSLLAVRLMARLEQHFGLNLPLATLLATPTIEQLASCLRASADSFSWSPLVAIQSGGDKRPFFCVPGVGGNVIYFYELARHLGLDQPFYGFSAKGLDGESEPLIRVEDIAAYYIEAMQTLQPNGPYLLGGHSFGGVVAFEMAIQLHKQGHEVALVAIIDAIAPILNQKSNCVKVDEAAYLTDFASYVADMLSLDLEVSKETLASLTAVEQLHYLKERLIRVNLLPPDAGIKLVRGLVQVFKANNQAHRVYLPSGVQLPTIVLFRAGEVDVPDAASELTQLLKEPALGWNEISATREIHVVPGNHMTMMAVPHVQVLAAQLLRCLEQAQAHLPL